MVACLIDDFNRADNSSSLGDATSGETWTLQSTAPYNVSGSGITAVPSILGINSNQAYSSDNSPASPPADGPGHLEIGTLDCGFANLDVSLDLVLPFAQGGGGGVTFRWVDATHFWIALLYRRLVGGSDYLLYLRKQTGSGASFTNRVNALSVLTGSATGTHTLRVETCRDRIQTFIDGTQKADFTDTFNQAGTKHGIQTYFSTTVRLDNLSICPHPCGGWGRRRFGGAGF